jgi:hypothetical protein
LLSGPPQLPAPQNQNHLPLPENHLARPNSTITSAPNRPPVAKILPRSTSAPTDGSGEGLDDRETPLKKVVRTERVVDSALQDGRSQSQNQAGENPQASLSQPIGNEETFPSQPISRPDTVWTSHSRSSVSLESGDLEADGPHSSFNPHSNSSPPSSFGPPSSFLLQGPAASTSSPAPSFVASIQTLHCDRSLYELQRQRQQLADDPRTKATAREAAARATAREAAARALIDQEGVSSVRSNNSIELPMDAEDSHAESSERWASLTRSDAALLAGQAARHSSRMPTDSTGASTGASQNPLADGVNAIINRLSQSFSAMAVTSGSQVPLSPNNGAGNGNNNGLQFELFSEEQQEDMADWLTQGARPRAPLPIAANPNPCDGPQPPPAPLPDRPNTVGFAGVSDSEPGERRGRERTTGARRDHNRVSSTREATFPQSPSTSPRRRQQSRSPPRRLQRDVPGRKQLRAYQLELAESALAGNNCIICAPTGSGKTMTAAHICRERMRLARPHRFKTLFIVCIR